MLAFLNEHSTLIQAIFTIVIAILTYYYVRWTRIMAHYVAKPDVRAENLIYGIETYQESEESFTTYEGWFLGIINKGTDRAFAKVERKSKRKFLFINYEKRLQKTEEVIINPEESRNLLLKHDSDIDNEIIVVIARDFTNVKGITKWRFNTKYHDPKGYHRPIEVI